MGNSPLRIPALRGHNVRRFTGHDAKSGFESLIGGQAEILQQQMFHSMLTLERRRTERSRKPFVLMLLDAGPFVENEEADRFMSQVASVLLRCTRETDLVGWHKKGVVLGIIFTEISLEFKTAIAEVLHSKVVSALHDEMSREVASNLVVTVHLFPESRD